MRREDARAYRRKIELAAAAQSDEAALESIDLFPSWKAGMAVKVGERYRYGEKLYRVVQAHTTQVGWTPDVVPALFTVVSLDEWPEYVHPTGAADAYIRGDKVTFQGRHYICQMDGCVWSPADYPAAWILA